MTSRRRCGKLGLASLGGHGQFFASGLDLLSNAELYVFPFHLSGIDNGYWWVLPLDVYRDDWAASERRLVKDRQESIANEEPTREVKE